MRAIVLDGAMGTEILARGLPIAAPSWSASALERAPALVSALHAEYAGAGAIVHTANTFRTRPRQVGERWEAWTDLAVRLARAAIPPTHRVAGSLAPVEDCYRPDLSPADPRPEHTRMARRLAAAGVDIILCETFPHVGEALIAVEEAVATGVETWVSFTAGPSCDLLSPEEVRRGAREAVARGAHTVLVNCIPATHIDPWIRAIAGLGVPFGAYANAGAPAERLGWGDRTPRAAAAYAEIARGWIALGASVVGGCCGTTPRHVAALSKLVEGG